MSARAIADPRQTAQRSFTKEEHAGATARRARFFPQNVPPLLACFDRLGLIVRGVAYMAGGLNFVHDRLRPLPLPDRAPSGVAGGQNGRKIMRKILFLLPVAGLLLAGPALAAHTFGGVVSHVNPAQDSVTLIGSGTFRVSEPRLLRGIYRGEHVIVTKNDNGTVGLQEDSGFSSGSGHNTK